jgi:formyl-CoA transferase
MLALEGLKVLDLTQHLSGPYCTMLLGDLGADILKIEKPKGGDDQRKLGPFVNGESSPFMMINRNKRSLTLDLKQPVGRALLLQLAKSVDVFIENFRPGVAKSLGIDYAAIRDVNPAVVYCSISGYGQTGPYASRGGFDILAQGLTGTLDLNTPTGARPEKLPISIHDLSAGMTAMSSILAAYIHRLKTGVGQYIDVSLIEAGLAMTPQEASACFVNGTAPKVVGTSNHLSSPYQAYQCRDGYVIIGAGNQKLWEKFCNEVVRRPEWIDDPRFATNPDRVKNVAALEALIQEVLLQDDVAFWIAKLDLAGIPGGPINTYEQALKDPHLLERDMVPEIDHPRAGRMKVLGIPAKMSETPGTIRRPAPILGEHSEEILEGWLGLGASQLADLRTQKVI